MTTINIGKVTKIFTHYYKIAGLHDSKIITYKIKPSNLFAEILSKEKIIVYGDYDILLCFTNNSSGKQKYSAKFLRKTFCEIVNYELTDTNEIVNMKDIEAVAVFLTQPTCFLNITNSGLVNTYIDIRISGEIRVDLFVSDKINSDHNTQLVRQEENNSKNEIVKEKKLCRNEEGDIRKDKKQNSDIQYWQFEPEDNLTVHDMLEMDLEILKNSARQIELKMPYNIIKDDNKKNYSLNSHITKYEEKS